MKYIPILFFSLFLSIKCFSQIAMAPMEIPKSQMLASDAYNVYKTNKFLNFKDADTLKEMIDGKLQKAYNLKTFFSKPKNWAKIAQEDTSYYSRNTDNYNREKYKYQYTDTAMIETYSDVGSYGVHRDFKTVYNLKGFITYTEEKIFINDTYTETRSIANVFDDKNCVIKIIKHNTYKNQKENTIEIIEANYNDNEIIVKSKNGEMVCLFTKKSTIVLPKLFHPVGQDENVYRLFDATLTKALITAVVTENNIAITQKSTGENDVIINEKMLPTTKQNIYYFNGALLQKISKGKNNLLVLKLDKANKTLQLFGDTTFVDKYAIEKFITKPQNLTTSVSFYLLAELNLEEAKSYPPITTLSKTDQVKFKQMENIRTQEIALVDEAKLSSKEKMKMFVQQMLIISRNCFLLGYKPPADKEEMDFLRQFIFK